MTCGIPLFEACRPAARSTVSVESWEVGPQRALTSAGLCAPEGAADAISGATATADESPTYTQHNLVSGGEVEGDGRAVAGYYTF